MGYLVLTQEQNDWLLNEKVKFKSLLDSRFVDVVPIPIKSGEYIVSLDMLKDDNFKEFRDYLYEGGHIQKVLIRDVDNFEFYDTI